MPNLLTMVGAIDRCWLFTFRTAEAEARRFVPAELDLETHGGFAFWNVVVTHLDRMRPLHLPRPLGISYWQSGYRLHVRYRAEGGRVVEGLYFVRSECDRTLLAMAGNALTDFRFHTAPIDVDDAGDRVTIDVGGSFPARATVLRREPPALTPGSPFRSIAEAAKSLQYKPCGISVRRDGSANLVRIERDERQWQARPVTVIKSRWSFFEGKLVEPELAFEVAPIDYVWRRSRVEKPALRGELPCASW